MTTPTLLAEPTEKMRLMVAHVLPQVIELLAKIREMGIDRTEVVVFIDRYTEPYVAKHTMELANGRIRIAPEPFTAIQQNVQMAANQGRTIHPNTIALLDLYGKEPEDIAVHVTNQNLLFLGFAKKSFGLDLQLLWPELTEEQKAAEKKALQEAMQFFALTNAERSSWLQEGKSPPEETRILRLLTQGYLSQTPATEDDAKKAPEGSVFMPNGMGGFIQLEATETGRQFLTGG